MSELSPRARALLEAARRNHGPSEDERDRVLMGLHASLGIAAVLPTLADASIASAGTSGPQLVQPAAPAAPMPQLDPTALLGQAANTSALGGSSLGTSSLGWSKLFAWKAGKVWLASLVIGGSAAVGISALPASHPQTEEALSARKSSALVAPSKGNKGDAPVEPVAPVAPEQVELVAPAPAREEVVPAPAVDPSVAPATVTARAVAAAAPARDEPQLQLAVASAVAVREPSISTRSQRSARAQARLTRQVSRRARREQARERELLAPKPVAEEPIAQPVAEEPPAPSLSPPPSPELALIRAALTSLRDHDSMQALRLLDEHAARYPNGAFANERRGLHAIAQCAAGRYEDGSRERAAFLKTAGKSPIAARVRSACPH
jgi:hypothetical protein